MYPDEFRYSKDHEWVELEGTTARIGITDFAQEQLGDITFIELPKVGDVFKQNDTFGSIESVKAVSDLYCPVSGEVIQVNEALEEEPDIVNEDPHGEGWLIVVKIADPADLDNLLTHEEYESHIGEEDAEEDEDFEEDEEDFEDGDYSDDDYDGDDENY